ncbi:2-hydroxyacid dehydrogenase [Brevibacillus marinus]|uniref:2-hydroxyacid dehydrogenase n=1 Tax=Brevibacillus marinus TaxID=2496837 RepID=UPI000F848D66|nr:D-glycerate dehydrogenase [Brevibacillus marinus]
MRPKVIVYSKVADAVLDWLRTQCDVTYFAGLNAQTYPLFERALAEADGLLGAGLRVDQTLLEKAPRLKIVSNISVGYDNLDIGELTKRGIMATNTPDVLNDTVADAIFALLLAAARRIAELDRYVRAGQWRSRSDEHLFGVDVHHKVLGIIGMGRIGAAIAKRARFGFDMKILYHNRSRNMEAERNYQATYCTLEELLAQADFVCLMTPLTPQTERMIGEREFSLMKKSAVFVNGSRGATVDEEALVRALRNREILAAGLDVFAQEPLPADHPLLSLDNVVTVPHIGSATHETRFKMAKLAAESLVAGLSGKLPDTLINRERFA